MLFYAQKMPKKDLFAHASQYAVLRPAGHAGPAGRRPVAASGWLSAGRAARTTPPPPWTSCLMAAAATPSLVSAEVVAQVGAAPYACIVGFGSLLSEASAMLTCPGVRGFRLARVRGWRRVFAHPAHIFFARGIAVPATREIASLSAEPQPDGSGGFVVATFQVPTAELGALLEREEVRSRFLLSVCAPPETLFARRGG
eukprot:COSAG01_NODE_22473_length_854_cov_1.332450_2_plen_199_part_01